MFINVDSSLNFSAEDSSERNSSMVLSNREIQGPTSSQSGNCPASELLLCYRKLFSAKNFEECSEESKHHNDLLVQN